jgi:RHS repeat-associated protein
MQHKIGFMAQEAGYYIDVKAGVANVTSKHNTEADRLAVIKATSLISSALEHGILAQAMGTSGASTMSLFQIANNTGRKVFQATSSNWAAIKQELQAQNPRTYSDASLTNFETMINNSKTLILPDNGLLTATGWSWKGMGYIAKYFSTNTTSMAMIIGGGYYGGYNSNQGNVSPDLIKKLSELLGISIENAYKLWDSIKTTLGDPVDAASGTFVYSNTDLALGGPAPLGLSFSRSYASGDNLGKKAMGYGFTHNYDITVKTASHGDPGFGGRQPVDAASMIAALYVELDLLRSLDTIEAWMDASLTSKWAIDQVIDNVVNFNIGGKMLEYVKLPDNTYAPPPGVNTQLIKNTNGTYSLQERFGKRMDFNTDNKLYQIIDVDGNTATFEYNSDTDKTLHKVTDAFGRSLTLNYTSGNITSVTDSSTPARTVYYSYDANNNLTGYTDAENKPWTYVYATPSNHRITGLTNPLNISTITNLYDSLGRVKTQTAPRQGGGTATYNYYFAGYRNQEVDPQGNATTYYFDEKGRQYAKEDALGNKETKTYDGQNHVVSVTGPRSTTSYPVVTTFDYDGNNNVTKVTNPLSYYTNNTYDTQFRLTDTKDNDNADHNVHFDYDTEHHLINTTFKTTSTASYSVGSGYYDNGLRQTATDGRGTVTAFTYDAYGNPQTSKTAAHPQVTYTYDSIGRTTDLYDQENPSKSTHFVYDKRGLLQSKTDMLDKGTTYTYYDNGLLHTKTDRKNQTISYTYTPTDKPDTITYPDTTQNVNFTYNNLDQLTGMTDSIGRPDNRAASYGYDAVGRLTSMTDSNGFTIGYAYDAAGNLTTLTYPGNKVVSYTYDKLNRIKTVTINWLSNQTATYADYDAAGRLPGYTNFNGTLTAYGYDNASRLTSISNKKSDNTTVISDYAFTLDNNGNRTNTVQNEQYVHAVNEGSATYTYNTRKNRMTAVNSTDYTYDDEGQLATGGSTAYTFDYEHRLKTIGGTSNQFFYDGLGNRLKAIRSGVTTKYIYDAAGRLLAEADGSGVITRYYIYGNGLLAAVTPANSVYCYHFNGVGSTVAITGSTQAVVNKYAYDPFGNIASQSETVMTAQPFKYVGQYGVMTESNGFYYMKARYYDPTVGRFISEDPIGFNGGDTNLMAYVGNNPVTGIDPEGLCATQINEWFFNLSLGDQVTVITSLLDILNTAMTTGGLKSKDQLLIAMISLIYDTINVDSTTLSSSAKKDILQVLSGVIGLAAAYKSRSWISVGLSSFGLGFTIGTIINDRIVDPYIARRLY